MTLASKRLGYEDCAGMEKLERPQNVCFRAFPVQYSEKNLPNLCPVLTTSGKDYRDLEQVSDQFY